MDFKSDLNNLISLINQNASEGDIKKTYLTLVKKYHPDSAPENLKASYNEYMILINTVYSKGKTKVREVQFKNPKTEDDKKKQNDYFRKVFDLGKAEFEEGFRILHEKEPEISIDRKAMDEVNLKIMGYYLNAIKCYSFVIKNCSDRVLVDSAKFEVQMLKDYNAKLAKTLLNNNEKMLAVI